MDFETENQEIQTANILADIDTTAVVFDDITDALFNEIVGAYNEVISVKFEELKGKMSETTLEKTRKRIIGGIYDRTSELMDSQNKKYTNILSTEGHVFDIDR